MGSRNERFLLTTSHPEIKLMNMNKTLNVLIFTFFFVLPYPVFAVEVAPRISDREIVEGLTEIRGDIKRLDARIDALSSKMDDKFAGLRSEMNDKFDGQRSEMNGKFADLRSEMNGRFEDMNHRFDTLHWTLGIFITIALVILGFVLRMQWQMHRRQTQTETILDTQRSELSFIKGLIEKLMPPRGVL